jgi:hypothetical protein
MNSANTTTAFLLFSLCRTTITQCASERASERTDIPLSNPSLSSIENQASRLVI